MSYADVAAHNAPPISQQPHADQSLLNTTRPSADPIADDGAKVNLVPSDFKSHPATMTSEADIIVDADSSDDFSPSESRNTRRRHAKSKRRQEAEAEGLYIWETAKHYLFRPGVAGGLVGLINIGLLAGASRAFYTQPHLRRDTKVISSTVAATLALFTAEGFAVEKYSQTPRGKAEAKRAKEEGTLLYKHAQEAILRPGVAGGIVGILNAAILGAVGYFSYIHWSRPTWDRRIVSAVSVGLLTLWGGEGFLAERLRK